MSTLSITAFKDDYAFLSNFYPKKVRYGSRVFKTLEHAYQAAKSKSSKYRDEVLAAPEPRDAKKLGRKVKLRSDWEQIKLHVMEKLLRRKFSSPALRSKLVATGKAILIEGNWWHDEFWGVCRGKGLNHLGKLLMKLRFEFQQEDNAVTEVVNKKTEAFDIYIGRPSIYGNPFEIGRDGSRKDVITKFKKYFEDKIRRDKVFRDAVLKLKGLRLGCFCKPLSCHGDIYVRYLESPKLFS